MQIITVPAGATVYTFYSMSTEGPEKLDRVNLSTGRAVRSAFVPSGVFTSKCGEYLCWRSWGRKFAVRKGDTVVTDYEATLRNRG